MSFVLTLRTRKKNSYMKLENIGNPQYVYVDKNGYAIREGLWYVHMTSGAIKVMSISDLKMDYQTLSLQNTGVYKVLSGHVSLELFTKQCVCTGFVPNGEVINPDIYDTDFNNSFVSSASTKALVKELINRNEVRIIDEKLNLYEIQ